jgi:hypothetical protein
VRRYRVEVDDDDPAGEAPVTPPSDPEEWSDEQWLAWLKATDDQPPVAEAAAPVTTGARLARSAGGSVLAQAMLGMAHAIYGRRDDEVVIVVDGGSEPDEDQPFEVHLDAEYPERSSVVFRSRPRSDR